MALGTDSDTVRDVLIGESSVIVETSDQSYKLEKIDETTVEGNTNQLTTVVVDALESRGMTIESNYPQTIEVFAHDEPEPFSYTQVADKLNLDEDSSLAREIAGITTEIDLTIKVYEDNTWEVTHVFGNKLETPHSYTR